MTGERNIQTFLEKYSSIVLSPEKAALRRKGKVVQLRDDQTIVIQPDIYEGNWHIIDKSGGFSSEVTLPNRYEETFVIMSPNVLKNHPELIKPGLHPKVILLDKRTTDIEIGLGLNKHVSSSIPIINIANTGIQINVDNPFTATGKTPNFGPGVTVNNHSLLLGLPHDQVTKLLIPGGSIELKGINGKSVQLSLKLDH